ncbi:MAG: hypothetical protein FWE25_09085 [Lachnospiraceae bacterium]|nr:hypothetical protein [Lachnospiraceae bacterium]
MFIGRKKELQDLEKLMKSKRFEMPVIYGRRRIGKTRLIREFVKDKRAIFFTATQAKPVDNLEQLAKAINALDGTIKVRGELSNFQQGFEVIADID